MYIVGAYFQIYMQELEQRHLYHRSYCGTIPCSVYITLGVSFLASSCSVTKPSQKCVGRQGLDNDGSIIDCITVGKLILGYVLSKGPLLTIHQVHESVFLQSTRNLALLKPFHLGLQFNFHSPRKILFFHSQKFSFSSVMYIANTCSKSVSLSLQLIFVGSFYLSVFICALDLLTLFYISVSCILPSAGHMVIECNLQCTRWYYRI